MKLTPEERKKQERYRDARFTDTYDEIWQSVGKCVFCDMRDKYIFFEDNGIVMTVSLYAYIDGHFMIVPRRHMRSPKELTQAEWDTVRKFTYIAKKLIKDVHSVKGMQLVQKDGSNAQSTVDQHLHFHCIPFDSPDLSVWNYRRLKHTPLESAEKYRRAGKKIIRAGHKYHETYAQPSALPVVCDAVIVNDKDEVLLMERSEDATMIPPHDTTPGGHVDDFSRTLEEELAREILEETGLTIKPSDMRLVASRIDEATYARTSPHLKARYSHTVRFLYNTYHITGISSDVKLRTGDDAARLYWQPVSDAIRSSRLTPALQQSIKMAVS